MSNNNNVAKIPKGLRLDENIVKSIEKQAKKERRSFNAMVDIILEEWDNRNKKTKSKPNN